MKITIAKTAGFCMGVRRAVDMVLDASNTFDGPIYTYGPLIHNPQVLEMLEGKKIFQLDSIPEKGEGLVLIRAHGVPPEDEIALNRAGFRVMNATCPRVIRVQVIIDKHAKKGYSTIIVGDPKHPEVVGLLGYTRGSGYTVTSMDQLRALPRFENAVLVAQTTQNTALYEEIKEWCTENAPHYMLFDTICGSTEKRQAEARDLAGKNDALIVVGGKQSGNTRRLAQVAAETQIPAVHIEDVSELDISRLMDAGSIAITAGASTPNWIITDTCAKVEKAFQQRRPVLGAFVQARDFLTKTNLLLAAGAGSLAYACSVLQGFSQTLDHSVIAMLYVLSMQVLNNIFTIKADRYNNPDRAVFYEKYLNYLRAMALCSGTAGLYIAYSTGPVPFFILLIMSLLGLAYNSLKISPLLFWKKKKSRIKDIPGSKTVLITLAWGIVTCILPAVSNRGSFFLLALAFLFSTGLAFARTAFFDILAIQGDRISGKETLPILLGEQKSFHLIMGLLIFDIVLMMGASFLGLLPENAFWLALVPLFMVLLIRVSKKDKLLSGGQYEFLIESSFLAAGGLAAVI
ncbi:4-hydroxy-3-methylbut-2-enyl diphosphate reductase [Desulfospira joergensenii]|uniref:4-hydroxy-3-methylbut-2-enyl diphosphate reductase n=1 Tax=Desulfospira joergensenii TaxID=53329 RepID=UPI0003B79233|nr:4-hydroxy-3-methylbut-2-enyl diphosphate reductase [Desulfospira joergensenii]